MNKLHPSEGLSEEKLRINFRVTEKRERVAKAGRIATAFGGGHWLRGYIRGKLLTDPVFDTALAALQGREGLITDLGCGLGLFGLWLKAHGHVAPYKGCDLGGWKINEGRRVATELGYEGIMLDESDLTIFPLENSETICAFDILHYLPPNLQDEVVRNLARSAKGGALVLIRNGVRDCGWRSRVTLLEEWWTRASGWIRGGRINFPRLDRLVAIFEEEGCLVEAQPLWGKTPFSSYWLKVVSRH